MKKISVAISPCPNDTFMFDALLHNKIDCRGYEIEYKFADIDLLNKGVKGGDSVDFSKISYGVYPYICENYKILDSGSALGFGNAPLVVSKHKIYPDELSSCSIAIPGEETTAALLLKFGFGEVKELKSYLFSDIAEAVISGEVDAGVLIHEQRFVFEKMGLQLVADLGKIWEEKTALPVALGAIVASNSVDRATAKDFEQMLQQSIEFAFKNPSSSRSFVKEHARELADSVIDSHIEMFVNKFSLSLGDEGRKGVLKLLEQSGKELDHTIFL